MRRERTMSAEGVTSIDSGTESQAVGGEDLASTSGMEVAATSDGAGYASEGDTSSSPGPVPYDRFQQVIAQKNDYQAKVNDYQDQISQLQQYIEYQNSQSQQAVDPVEALRRALQPEPEPEYVDPLERKTQELEKQLSELSQWKQQQVAEVETARLRDHFRSLADSAISDYPNANKHEIALAFFQNPNLTLSQVRDVARQSHERETSTWRGRFAPAAPAPGTNSPPVLPQSGMGGVGEKQRITSIADAREAFLARVGID